MHAYAMHNISVTSALTDSASAICYHRPASILSVLVFWCLYKQMLAQHMSQAWAAASGNPQIQARFGPALRHLPLHLLCQ